jgi:hypothetical protein
MTMDSVPQKDELVARMRERVAKCRHLAGLITDSEAIAVLLAMADEGEADIARLEREGSTPDEGEIERRTDRTSLSAEVRLRLSGEHGYRVSVFDLSAEGCKIEFVNRPKIGAVVWVKFEDLEAVEASVRWVDGHIGGVRFQRPLHEAVFQRLAKNAAATNRTLS